MEPIRDIPLPAVRRAVVKIGSRVLAGGQATGVDATRIAALADEVLSLAARGVETVVVSSGAIACGVRRLGLAERPDDLPRLQAAAAAGQIALMRLYEEAFSARGRVAAQVLLTHADVADRRRFLNARGTLRALLDLGAVPIVNENDTVATAEIRFGDNDNLSADVAAMVEADLLVLLTDVEGLHEADPRANPGARRVPVVRDVLREAAPKAGGTAAGNGPGGGAGGGRVGTGGMATKVEAARKAAENGIATVVADGKRRDILEAIFRGDDVGTLFLPRAAPRRLPARKHWIAFTLKPRGALVVDDGARAAIVERGKSLLASGVRAVDGGFARGEAVAVRDAAGTEVARGLAAYDADDLRRIAGRRSDEIKSVLGFTYGEVVHRDDLVVLGR